MKTLSQMPESIFNRLTVELEKIAYFDRVDRRQLLIRRTCLTDIFTKIKWEGSADIFASELVKLLMELPDDSQRITATFLRQLAGDEKFSDFQKKKLLNDLADEVEQMDEKRWCFNASPDEQLAQEHSSPPPGQHQELSDEPIIALVTTIEPPTTASRRLRVVSKRLNCYARCYSDPDIFLLSQERQRLVDLLGRIFRRNYKTADQRDALFLDAGLHEPLRQAMRGEEIRPEVRLVDRFQSLKVFNLDYHPLRNLLAYLLEQEKVCSLLTKEEWRFCYRLLARAVGNLAALRARAALGRVGHTGGQGLGSGVLVAPGLLLTCPTGTAPDDWANVQVRLGFIDDHYPDRNLNLAIRRDATGRPTIMSMGDSCGAVLLSLDQSIANHPTAMRVHPLTKPMFTSAPLAPGALIYLWHHPGGQAAKLASGQVVAHAGDETSGSNLYYTIPGTPESRGGPLFDRKWRLVGLHIASEGELGRGVPLTACQEALLAAAYNKHQ